MKRFTFSVVPGKEMAEGKRGGGGALKFNTTLIPPKLTFSVVWGRVVITLNVIQHQISFLLIFFSVLLSSTYFFQG